MLCCSRNLKKWKMYIEFKHVRFKSVNKDPKEKIKLSKDIAKLRIQNLAELLSCNILTAQEMTVKNRKILALNNHDFYRNVKFCKNYLKLSDLIEFPWILSLNSSLLQHRFLSLKELGCSYVNASDLLKFPHILKKAPKTLERQGCAFHYDENFAILSKYLDNSDRREINSKLFRMYNDGSTLWKIKEAMNAEFLAAKFGCSIGRAHKMLRCYPPLRVQSIQNTDQLLNIFLEKLNLSFSKICNSLNLLSMHPEDVELFLLEIPEILGINTTYLVKKVPLLLRRSVDSVQKAEMILKDFSISEAQLMHCPKVMVFTPNTLQQRLASLCNSKDFSLLKSNKSFLWLVYNYNNVNSRLEALKANDVPCSINMFKVSNSNFTKKLCTRECRNDINDICFYLAEIFNITEREILTILREYPNYHHSSVLNCREVVEFLMQSGVTKKQILNGIGIIFYDADVVKVNFDDLKNHPECQPFEEWTSHYNLIQLLIYAIEVHVHFKGSDVYRTRCRHDEPEEPLLNYSSNF